MEENFNSKEELNEEALSKEEILARSRRENEKNGDEREQGKRLLSRNIGFMVTILACAIAMIVRVCLEDTIPFELMAIIFTGLFAQNTAELFFTTNKKLKALTLLVSAVSFAAAILYWVEWGLSFAG